jgi:hypothetical protein
MSMIEAFIADSRRRRDELKKVVGLFESGTMFQMKKEGTTLTDITRDSLEQAKKELAETERLLRGAEKGQQASL